MTWQKQKDRSGSFYTKIFGHTSEGKLGTLEQRERMKKVKNPKLQILVTQNRAINSHKDWWLQQDSQQTIVNPLNEWSRVYRTISFNICCCIAEKTLQIKKNKNANIYLLA